MIEASQMQEILTRFSHGVTTANAVYETLRHCIVEGAFRPGERLLSDDLANRLGVSRTPVREALRKLEAVGYATLASGTGLVVREYSEKDLDEVFFIRELLESAAARLAAENASSRDIERLKELLEDMEIADGNVDAFRRLTGEFHALVARASRNDRLADMLLDIQENVRLFSASTLFSSGRTAEALAEHRALFEAIKARDADRAEQLARDHRQKTLNMRRQLLRSEARRDMERDTVFPTGSQRG